MVKRITDFLKGDKRLAEPVLFVVKVCLVYIVWRFLKNAGEENPDFLFGYWGKFYDMMGNLLVSFASGILSFMGYNHIHNGRIIIIEGTRGLQFADLCIGIAPIFLFTGIIFSYGNNNKARLWFIPLGIVAINIINVFRLVCLALIQKHADQYFNFAHSYLYVVITYGLIFVLVFWWMNRLAFQKQ